ncbi:JAB domain-containing protein [Chondrinema litorale]|uniref:JAB domain-containing protein n=1 Tax=Chondrinema litorale TaxID=2994555 RepID=UPI002542AB75|nr:JAB domain-containing protein [Chondrinema litorale]UZR99834.1 JAB domain-containing protein [Chondrinema litorale]
MSYKKFDPNYVAEVKISYSSKVPASKRPTITSSASAAEILRKHWEPGQLGFVESFKILLLNRANKVLGIYTVSNGGISGTVADPKTIFIAALKSSSVSLVLCHNHPSSNTNPSQADINLTNKIKEAGKLLDIAVLDHIILTEENYFSFLDSGLL